MQRIRIGQGGAVLVAALASALAFTAGIAPRAEAVGGNVGGHVGYSKMKDAEGGAVLVGGHGELRLIRWLGVQGAVDYRHVSSFDIATPNGQGELSVREIPITVTGRVYMPISKVSPFAAAGAGWYHLIYDYSNNVEAMGADDKSTNTFGWHVGAGLEVQVAPHMSLYGEGRAVFLDPERDLDSSVFDQVGDFNYNSTYFAGGLNFLF
jgi:opacity protein-like surface antigen